MPQYRWDVAPVAPRDALAALGDFPPLVTQLLFNRGLRSVTDVEAFLGRRPAPAHDPFLLPEMDRAVARLKRAIDEREPVAVFGDFDADGVTGTALLVEGLAGAGALAVPYIPHREREGYGLNVAALADLRAAGARVVVAVDCGTSSLEEIARAAELGMDVVVADHHSIPPELPAAVALVNPHRPESGYPFRDFSGVGVGYKVLEALYDALGRSRDALEDVLDLVAIGTVADVVPLQGENRLLVTRGLGAMRAAKRPGLRELMRIARVEPRDIGAEDLAFRIAPRLNAMGRLEHAIDSYHLLVCREPLEAAALAEKLDATNRQRQELTLEAVERARRDLDEQEPGGYVIMVDGPDYPAGVMGLVASRLAEERYRPAVVVERGDIVSRGSARSIPEFSIVGALRECADLFQRYGGHPQAAGFTLATERLPELRARLSDIARRELSAVPLEPSLRIDAAVALRSLPGPPMAHMPLLAPFGSGNPEPLFLTPRVRVVEARPVGTADAHLQLKLNHQGVTWQAVGFNMGGRVPRAGERIDVVYSAGLDRRQDGSTGPSTGSGQRLLQLQVRDYRPSAPRP